MNIYYIRLDQDVFGLSAVVTAETKDKAIGLLDLDEEYQKIVNVHHVGHCTDGFPASVLCRESL